MVTLLILSESEPLQPQPDFQGLPKTGVPEKGLKVVLDPPRAEEVQGFRGPVLDGLVSSSRPVPRPSRRHYPRTGLFPRLPVIATSSSDVPVPYPDVSSVTDFRVFLSEGAGHSLVTNGSPDPATGGWVLPPLETGDRRRR